MRELFETFDDDESGIIEADEIFQLFQVLGVDVSQSQCHRLVIKWDVDRAGGLTYEKFAELMASIKLDAQQAAPRRAHKAKLKAAAGLLKSSGGAGAMFAAEKKVHPSALDDDDLKATPSEQDGGGEIAFSTLCFFF